MASVPQALALAQEYHVFTRLAEELKKRVGVALTGCLHFSPYATMSEGKLLTTERYYLWLHSLASIVIPSCCLSWSCSSRHLCCTPKGSSRWAIRRRTSPWRPSTDRPWVYRSTRGK